MGGGCFMFRKIAARCFIAVTVLFMGSILLRLLTQNILHEELHIDNTFTKAILGSNNDSTKKTINWPKLYPFQYSTVNTKNWLDDFRNKISRIKEKTEKYTKNYLINHINFVELAVRYEMMAGWHLSTDVIDLGGGYISETVEKTIIMPPHSNVSNINTPAAALYDFNDFLQGLGIDFLYIQSPFKISKKDELIGVLDFSNENVDELLYALSLKKIPYLDLRESICRENLDHHSLFYQTDSHWKAETGLWSTKTIAEYLNENNGFEIDLNNFDPDQFANRVYKNCFLGALGRRVTLAKAIPEDFTLLYPKFDTDFLLRIPEIDIDMRGDFDIFIDYRMLDIRDY
jgi:hypothetical protein